MAVRVFEFVCQGCREPTATLHAGLDFCDDCHDQRLTCDWCRAHTLASTHVQVEDGVTICADCDDRFDWSRSVRAQRARDAAEDQRDAEADERLLKVAS